MFYIAALHRADIKLSRPWTTSNDTSKLLRDEQNVTPASDYRTTTHGYQPTALLAADDIYRLTRNNSTTTTPGNIDLSSYNFSQ